MDSLNSAQFEIPIPPSTNNLFLSFVQKGKVVRRPTPEYAAWKKDCVSAIKAQRRPVMRPPLSLSLTIYGGKGFSVQSDVSNRFKAAEDALKEAGVISDDNVRVVVQASQRYVAPASSKAVARALILVQEIEYEGRGGSRKEEGR